MNHSRTSFRRAPKEVPLGGKPESSRSIMDAMDRSWTPAFAGVTNIDKWHGRQ